MTSLKVSHNRKFKSLVQLYMSFENFYPVYQPWLLVE